VTTTSIRALLGSQPVFAGLEPGDLDLLAGCARNVRFDTGASLAREGEPADGFYLVRHGRLAIEMPAPAGPLVVDSAVPGDLVGWSWLFPPNRWTADVRAVEPTRVVAVDGRCLRDKSEAEPAFGYRIMRCFARVMIERIDAMRMRLLDLYGASRAG
jgi:CRP/FNR family cyclic AMP-dependent transcriptional regulator